MKRILSVTVFAALLFWVGWPRAAAQQTVDLRATVQQFMPSYMLGELDPVEAPQSCSAVYSSAADGTPLLIVAAYTDGAFGDLRMISIDPSTLQPTLVAEVSKTQYDLGGGECNLEIVNLSSLPANPSMSKAVQLGFTGLSGRGEASWFFGWDGSKFVNLTPVEVAYNTPPPSTLLFEAGPIDVEHTGVKQIISNGNVDLHPGPDGLFYIPQLLWKFNGTTFVLEKTLVEAATFTRESGNPPPVRTDITPDTCYQTACQEFDVRGLATQYKLTFVNGNADGTLRCSSGYIILNNVIVISPDDLNQNVEFITKTVTLQTQNTLYASLASSPGNTVIITIEAQP